MKAYGGEFQHDDGINMRASHCRKVKQAFNDLKSTTGAGTFRTWWGLKVRHYAVLHIQAHYTYLRTSGYLEDIKGMFQVNTLQRILRAKRSGLVKVMHYKGLYTKMKLASSVTA